MTRIEKIEKIKKEGVVFSKKDELILELKRLKLPADLKSLIIKTDRDKLWKLEKDKVAIALARLDEVLDADNINKPEYLAACIYIVPIYSADVYAISKDITTIEKALTDIRSELKRRVEFDNITDKGLEREQ